MDSQLNLFPDDQPVLDNRLLFLALLPPTDVARKIFAHAQRLDSDHGLRGRLRPMRILHMSLHEMGGWSEQAIRAAKEAAKVAAQEVPPFEIRLDLVEYWSTSGALVLRTRNETNPELRNFHKRLGLALAERAGLKGVRFNLTPHVTMLYASNGVTEDLGEPVGWTVSEFVLVCSHQGQTHYEVIARHSLLP